MDKYTLDLTRPVQTRAGQKVTILKTGARGEFSVIGIVHTEDEDIPHAWRPTGAWHMSEETATDLINVPGERFVNVYETAFETSQTASKRIYSSTTDAKAAADELKGCGYIYHGTYRLVPA